MAATTSLHVALVQPDIPWNTGNAGRTCVAIGARLHLIAPLGFSLEARQVRRAGLDYWQHVEPCVWSRWEEFAEALPRLGEPFFFSAEATRDLWSVRYPERCVLIFGGETAGLPPSLREQYRRQLVAIPMRDGPVRSLNLSTSVAVAAFEVLRQWRCSQSTY
ncbi:MAG: tRNA (cytidine(34)-2'-O)-methyltransferase [bacterium]|nr:tRNA (cytidine(34)-2'-O)-methyltransferase [bacterium]